MGNPCAPPVAILFLDRFERQHLETVSEKPDFLVRYVDDYAGIWTHGEQALLDFVAKGMLPYTGCPEIICPFIWL